MKFLLDNQLPKALAHFLVEQGCQADHVLDAGLDEADDVVIWTFSRENDLVLVSKDEDFFHLANRLEEQGRLLWVRIGNCRKQYLLDAFREDLPRIMEAFASGYRIVELR